RDATASVETVSPPCDNFDFTTLARANSRGPVKATSVVEPLVWMRSHYLLLLSSRSLLRHDSTDARDFVHRPLDCYRARPFGHWRERTSRPQAAVATRYSVLVWLGCYCCDS